MNANQNAESIHRLATSQLNLSTALPAPHQRAYAEKQAVIADIKRLQASIMRYKNAAALVTC